MIDVLEAYPDEHVVNYSPTVVGAGFVLIVCVCVLGVFVWAGRGERLVEGWEKLPEWERYRPDWLGKRVSVVEIAARYRTTWAAGAFWPSKETHQLPPAPGESGGSWLYTLTWGFLGVWLFMTGVFFVFAGAIEEIEVFREEQLLSGAVCAGLALVLCGFWIVIFRIPFFSRREARDRSGADSDSRGHEGGQRPPRRRADGGHARLGAGQGRVDVGGLLDAGRRVGARHLGGADGARVDAAERAVRHAALCRARVWPLSGWLLYAASVNFGVAYQADSYPDGVRPVPTGGGTFAYRGSLWPVAVAALAGLVALIGAEPAHPVPLVVALVFFAPRYWQNIAAIVLGLVGVLLGVVRVWGGRS